MAQPAAGGLGEVARRGAVSPAAGSPSRGRAGARACRAHQLSSEMTVMGLGSVTSPPTW